MNIVITGASKGIGKAIAEKFAEAGCNLFLCSRTESALQQTVNDLSSKYPQCKIHSQVADLGIQENVQAFAKWVLANAYNVDMLINNAGQFIPGSVYNEPEGSLENMMQVNLYSAYHLTRAILPNMIAAQKGHIFTICSIASLQAYANGGAYSISKFALAGFSKNLREEMKPFGIKVTAVYPGATMSDSWSGVDIDPQRIMEAKDIATLIFAAAQLSPQAVVEDIVLRPQLGDL